MSDKDYNGDKAATDDAPKAGEIPPNPLGTPKNMRRLKLSIAIMTFLLIAGTFTVIGTIIYRAMNPKANPNTPVSVAQGFKTLDVEVDRGTLVTQIEIDGDRMAVHVTRASNDEILIINIRSGELIGRINLKEKPAKPGQN